MLSSTAYVNPITTVGWWGRGEVGVKSHPSTYFFHNWKSNCQPLQFLLFRKTRTQNYSKIINLAYAIKWIFRVVSPYLLLSWEFSFSWKLGFRFKRQPIPLRIVKPSKENYHCSIEINNQNLSANRTMGVWVLIVNTNKQQTPEHIITIFMRMIDWKIQSSIIWVLKHLL